MLIRPKSRGQETFIPGNSARFCLKTDTNSVLLEKASLLAVDMEHWTSKAGRASKTSTPSHRVTGLVGMRAVVLLGLLAGATAFSGPSPVGEKLPPVPCARSERARTRARRRSGVHRKKAHVMLQALQYTAQLCASAAAGGAACRAVLQCVRGIAQRTSAAKSAAPLGCAPRKA